MQSSRTSRSTVISARKRDINLKLNAGLVAEAKLLNPHLSANGESLLVAFVPSEREVRLNRQQLAGLCVDDWNSVLDQHGSFADSQATL